MKKLTGDRLNHEWKVGAQHALYREDGRWYHYLVRFPGALFDFDGYILFRTSHEYEKCAYLDFGHDVHVPKGISAIPGYVRVRQGLSKK